MITVNNAALNAGKHRFLSVPLCVYRRDYWITWKLFPFHSVCTLSPFCGQRASISSLTLATVFVKISLHLLFLLSFLIVAVPSAVRKCPGHFSIAAVLRGCMACWDCSPDPAEPGALEVLRFPSSAAVLAAELLRTDQLSTPLSLYGVPGPGLLPLAWLVLPSE